MFRQTFPVTWTVIAVIAPPHEVPEIRAGPCRQMSCLVRWVNRCEVRERSSLHPMNHQEPSVQKQSSEDFIPERQLSNQARERTVERADEPPTQRLRLENPASSIRWSEVDEPGHWVPTTVTADEEDTWTETDREVLWQQQVDDHIWKNNGQPACLCHEEWDELFSNTCENITARVCFCRSECTGLAATRITRGDELPRHLIPESECQATVAEWTAILDTSAVTIISPTTAKDIRKQLSHRIVPSRHV